MAGRQTRYAIAPLFIDRWSPRAFTGEEIPDETLFTCFEAARWAASGFNGQPWRFIYAKCDAEAWPAFVSLLSSTNQSWAGRAAALVLFVSKTTVAFKGEDIRNPTHSFETGAAWSNFSHQAQLLGWHTHAMGGFDRVRAQDELGVPANFAVEAMAAIGRIGSPESLPSSLREREFPSNRVPLDSLVMEGRFHAE